MTDLAKMMAPIRDSIARTREKMEQIERLMVTATEADKLDCTSAAECAVERARRMLAELNGKAAELPKPSPGPRLIAGMNKLIDRVKSGEFRKEAP